MSVEQISMNQLITDNIDVWTSTVKTKSASGRGSSKKRELYGVKKLRELILELAVRGKLVPQDPTDEPAAILLERIAEEKAQLVKDKKIKKPKMLPDMEDQKPFLIPSNWSWSQLGFLTNYGVCDKAEPTSVSDDTWVLELEDVEKITSTLLKKVRFSDRAFKSSKNQFQPEDVIYGKLRPYLDKVLIADEYGVCTTEMIPVRAYRDLTPGYLRLVMKSPYFINYANDSTHGMNLPRMGTDKARAALFPLAPLFEQHRIVAKVDELMTLCDQLEQQTEASIEAHQVLVTTLLDTLTNSVDADELMQNWARISEHFDTLFTTEASIDQLKQTILQLAVMGKLVPQDPADEPAAKLLERIAEEKAQLIKDKKIKKQKALPPIADDEKPFELPSGWEWCRLGSVLQMISDYHANGGYKILKENVELLDTVDYAIMLRTTNFSSKNYNEYKYITESAYNFLEKSKLYVGDIIMNKIGDPGAAFFVDDRGKPMSLAMNLFLLRVQNVDSQLVYLYLKGNYQYIRSFANGTSTKTITKEAVSNLVFPLAPLKEQHRIVTKTQELMAICDRLKACLKESQIAQLHLTDVIIEQAV
ncbi:type I restriction enzyme S subunit [Vibrio crassostreae]|uniref:restriction endonuclease subunit S n=1 Tax=Vibrio crassostreae TaxID=246167 RepID=UPI0010E76FD4|nr:restriction endonuclease subunit S [Vibrio crassostreae]TCN79311.1 type I restriction enzyme S subunit [Vibrio crassostreae]TWD72943.1 type I restriction enzyme S subunit [Vibrio crassostreae]